MVSIVEDTNDYRELFLEEKKPVVIWGIGQWGRLLLQSGIIYVDDVCDTYIKKQSIDGFEVLSPIELEEKYKGIDFYNINTFGTTQVLQEELYIVACQYNYNAKIINLHTNIGFDLEIDSFEFCHENVPMTSHTYNCGKRNKRRTERAIEVAMAKYWIMRMKNVIEIGAVTPYYYPNLVNEIVDPADGHYKVSDHKSIFDVDLRNRNVVCLSTVEHIGTGQYNVAETKDARMAIDKLLDESAHCLITTPVGQNSLIDDYLRNHFREDNLTLYTRSFFGNRWIIVNKESNVDEIINYCTKVARVYESKQLPGGCCGTVVIMK